MTDEAFITAILANPEDAASVLVYADWLEENGDSLRAEYLRLIQQMRSAPKRMQEIAKQIDRKWVGRLSRGLNPATSQATKAGQRFVDNGDNTVTDLKHNLMWIKLPGLLPDPLGEFRVPRKVDWITANRGCEELQYVGFSDWRLPTVPEWELLCDDIADLNPQLYLTRDNSICWTSSESKYKPNEYYAASIGPGSPYDEHGRCRIELEVSGPWGATIEWQVRPVRSVE